jgi:hypothetical protein
MESNFGKKIDKMKNEKLFVSIILRDKYWTRERSELAKE